MGERSASGELLLERFDRMSQLHAQNADELAFLAAKEQRLKDAISADRSAASTCDDYLPKPVRRDDLARSIAGLVNRVSRWRNAG